MQFIHPGLLFGALLFAVPLIIHLLNRQRYRRRPWAAMEFLLAAYRKQRQRVRMENLLLLLLRCLIPIAIAFAIARPQLERGAALLGFATPTHHVLVLDASYSMGLEPRGGERPFERMRTLGSRLLERIDEGKGHTVTLVVAGVRTSIPLQEELNLSRAKAVLTTLPGPQDGGRALDDALDQVADLLEERDGEARVFLFSDLQARAFGPVEPAAGAVEPPPAGDTPPEVPADALRDTLRDQVERITKLAELTVLDVGEGSREIDNLQIVRLELGQPHAIARVPVPVTVTLWNRGRTGRDAQVTLDIDGAEPARESIRVDAGVEAQATFLVTFREPGEHRLRARIEGDALPADDERFRMVPVRDRLRVLVVEGSSETDPALRDSSHFLAILDPHGGDGPPAETMFAPKVIDTVTLLGSYGAGRGGEPLERFDLIVLANVDRIDVPTAQALAKAVAAGSGLFVMLGDRCDLDSYNASLHDLAGGTGLMPMRLTRIPEGFALRGDTFWSARILRPAHPVFGPLQGGLDRTLFELMPIWRFVAADASQAPEQSELIATVRDPDESPLLISNVHGNGRTLWLTSAITARPEKWNGLDFHVVALPFFIEVANWLTLPAHDAFNAETGTLLTAAMPFRPTNIAVLLPERAGGAKVPIGDESMSLPGDRFALPQFGRTEFAGVYTFEMLAEADGQATPATAQFAVNVPVDEGDLRYLSSVDLAERYGLRNVLRELPSEGAVVEAGLGDLGLPLLMLALLILLSEAALARFVARRRGA